MATTKQYFTIHDLEITKTLSFDSNLIGPIIKTIQCEGNFAVTVPYPGDDAYSSVDAYQDLDKNLSIELGGTASIEFSSSNISLEIGKMAEGDTTATCYVYFAIAGNVRVLSEGSCYLKITTNNVFVNNCNYIGNVIEDTTNSINILARANFDTSIFNATRNKQERNKVNINFQGNLAYSSGEYLTKASTTTLKLDVYKTDNTLIGNCVTQTLSFTDLNSNMNYSGTYELSETYAEEDVYVKYTITNSLETLSGIAKAPINVLFDVFDNDTIKGFALGKYVNETIGGFECKFPAKFYGDITAPSLTPIPIDVTYNTTNASAVSNNSYYIPIFNMVVIDVRFTRKFSASAKTDYTMATVPSEYAPSRATALTLFSSSDASTPMANINGSGEINIRITGATNPTYFYLSGVYMVQ